MGTRGEYWSFTQSKIADLTRACWYDRVGLGKSDPYPKQPYTTQDMVDDLHKLLENADVAGPYVYVAHSLAGLNARLYASQYPQDVVGMVLIEAAPPDQFERLLTAFPPESPDDSDILREVQEYFAGGYIDDYMTAGPEFLDWPASAAQVRAAGSFGSIPLVVLSADPWKTDYDYPRELRESLYRNWVQIQEELAALSSSGTQIIVEDSGHCVHCDQPYVVIDVIHDVVTQARGDALPTPTPVPSLSPSPRGYHAMAYDVESDRVLLFGDIILSSEDQVVQFAETRAHDPGTGTWEVMDSTELPCTEGCPVAYDIQSDRVVMLHGFTADLETWDWEAVSDTWAYDYNTDTWTKMEPAETPIELRLGPNMVYDAESDRMIMFGGLDPENWEFHNDTWAYDLDSNTWTKMDPEVSPSGRDYFAMTYDAGSDRVILFGGAAEPIAGDTWSYDYNTDTWEELQPAEAPAPREYSAMVYDAGSDRVILFGGENESKANVFNDIWAYDFDSNTWTELEPDVSPSERGWHAMVYSTKAKQVVVLGGGRSRQTYTDETWTYDSAADTWTNVTPDS